MAEIEFDTLCQDATDYLDLDPRYWDSEVGSFEWHGKRVFFTKKPDSIVLEVEGRTFECGRH